MLTSGLVKVIVADVPLDQQDLAVREVSRGTRGEQRDPLGLSQPADEAALWPLLATGGDHRRLTGLRGPGGGWSKKRRRHSIDFAMSRRRITQ